MSAETYRNQYLALYLNPEQYAVYPSADLGITFDGTHDFTVGMWFLPRNANAVLLSFGQIFELTLSGNQIGFELNGLTRVVNSEEKSVILDGRWNYVAVAYSSRGQYRMYLNGFLCAVLSVSGVCEKSAGRLLIGRTFYGYIREICFYRQALAEVVVFDEMSQVKRLTSMTRYLNFKKGVPMEEVKGTPITLYEGAKVFAIGSGIYFNGNSGIFPLDGRDVNPGGCEEDQFSVQCWVQLQPGIHNFSVIFSNGGHYRNYGMCLFLEKDGEQYKLCASRGTHTKAENKVKFSEALPLNTWLSLAVTYDGKALSLYVSGVKKAETTACLPLTEGQVEGKLRIGTDDLLSDDMQAGGFYGYISRIDVWRRSLTQPELEKYMVEEPARDSQDLAASYLLDEIFAYNRVNHYSLGVMGMNRERLCRTEAGKSLNEDFYSRPAVVNQNWKKMPETFHRELRDGYLKELPSEEELCRILFGEHPETFWGDQMSEQRMRQCCRQVMEYQRKRKSGEAAVSFYTFQIGQDGICRFFLHEDETFQVFAAAAGETDPLYWWTINFLCTLFIGAVSIWYSLPQKAKELFPEILDKALSVDGLIPKIMECYNKLGGLKATINLLVELIRSGILTSVLLSALWQSGITGTSFLVSMLAENFLKALSSPWSYIVTAAKLAALGYDLYKLYQKMPETRKIKIDKIRFCGQDTASVSISQGYNIPPIAFAEYSRVDKRCCPVAYSLKDAEGKAIQIEVTLMVFQDAAYYIRAQADEIKSILGPVQSEKYTLKKNTDEGITMKFSLPQHKIKKFGVGEYQMKWNWQYSLDGVHFNSAESMEFQVFVLLDHPAGAAEGKPPWKSALQTLCQWTRGITDTSRSGESLLIDRVIDRLWDLKPYASMTEPWDMQYTSMRSNLHEAQCQVSRFLKDIKQGDGIEVGFNDCAALLASFCSLLGCAMETRLIGTDLKFERVILIGASETSQFSRPIPQYETACRMMGEQLLIYDCFVKYAIESPIKFRFAKGLPFKDAGAGETAFTSLFPKSAATMEIEKDQYKNKDGKREIV